MRAKDENGNQRRGMLETKQLKIFKTIVEVGSFTRAGARLNLSQPAISQHIRALEEQVGVPVLLRVGKRARPTPAGEVLLQCAQQVLDKIEDVQRVLADQSEGRAGIVRIGSGDAACHHLLPGVLKEFMSRFPKVHLHMATGHSGLTIMRILNGDLDIGLVTLPVEAEKVRMSELGRDELVAIVPPQHPWAGRRRVRATDFAGQPVILYERQSPMTDMVLNFLLEEGVFPRVSMEVDRLTLVKEMVRNGLGIAVVPRWAVRDELAAGMLSAVSLGKSGLSRAWGLVCLDHGQRPATFKALVRLCVERVPPLLAG